MCPQCKKGVTSPFEVPCQTSSGPKIMLTCPHCTAVLTIIVP
jgi:hypothetical protein